MDNINLIVRVLPGGDELDIELPTHTTAKEIIDEILSSGMAPRADQQGNPYTYELATKGQQSNIMPEKTLHDIGVRNGDTLLLMPRLVAGQEAL